MPDRDGEFGWSAIDEALKGVTGVELMVKRASAMQYHQFHIHGAENPLGMERLLKKTHETFAKHLTPEQMKALRDAHKLLPPHHY